MIIKERDSKQADIEELTSLLSLPLPDNKRFLVERELRFIKSGERGEKDSAYFIDFYYGPSERWAVIHDLRLELLGQVAQIDHLLINRFFDMYILESKNFSYGVKITETGEFLAVSGNKYIAIESPIEQNKRHVFLLEKILGARDIMPTRLGMSITPALKSYILISPTSRLLRPAAAKFDTSMVIKADTLNTTIDERVDKASAASAIAAFSKMAGQVTMLDVAQKIAGLHKPVKIDYRRRFGIAEASLKEPPPGNKETQRAAGCYCFTCKKEITRKVADFCRDNKKRFGGRVYCFDCQKTVAKE